MYIYKSVEGYEYLNEEDAHLFKEFCRRFYETWEFPFNFTPMYIAKVNNKNESYLKVELIDNSWLHIIKNRNGKVEWY